MSVSSIVHRIPMRVVWVLVATAAAACVIAVLALAPNDRTTQRERTDADPVVATARTVAPSTALEAKAADGVATDSDAFGGGAAAVAPDVAVVDTLDAPALDARIVRTGTIGLRVKRGAFEDTWGRAQAVAGGFGGYVVSASRSGAGDDARIGSITMRVPSQRFDAAVDRLRSLHGATVERLDVASQDVTQEFVDAQSRLRHDRAVEARLLTLLARTATVSEVLAVQARLDQVQEQIEVSKGRIQYLDKLTRMSTIELSLREREAGATKSAHEDSTLGRAWGDAGDRLAGNVASIVVWVGGAIPALVLLAIVAVVGRVAWTRRRSVLEHVVDRAEDPGGR